MSKKSGGGKLRMERVRTGAVRLFYIILFC